MRSSRGNAWPARRGNRKMHSRQNTQGHKPHFIVFVRRANRHKCVVFAIRARTKRNFLAGPGNEHAGAVECVFLDCSGKAWGWWRCSVCKVKQAACAFESWLAQHRSCNGDQVCSNCWQCPIPRGSISKAVQRVAATQAKVARRAAEEKKARAIADVWDAIAERKRNREDRRAPKGRKQSQRQNSADKRTEQK